MTRLAGGTWRLFAAIAGIWPTLLSAQTIDDLRSMSIADLAAIDVSSVTKSAGALRDAPAAIFVITHDDIIRSGARSIPEMLRLAPNLHVARTGSSTYIIAARGHNGLDAAQNFPNKLLVLIDGRSVYTPLFSGVYWDMQDVLPDDIDRIEVISGPGATLWGANAVNGVINIITRKSANTQGVSASVAAGDEVRDATLRFGGSRGDTLSYRLYAHARADRATDLPVGGSADNRSHREQGGFRVDWTPASSDMFTLQGDIYGGKREQGTGPDEHIRGQNLLGRWNRSWSDGSALQVQTYYDHAGRRLEQAQGKFAVDIYDLDIQHSLTLGGIHAIVWGGGIRANRFDIDGSTSLLFDPARRTLLLANAFVQDSIAITPKVSAILGLKVEDDPYVDAALLPSARLSWNPRDNVLLWAAASRAIRAPTPFDRDVIERIGGVDALLGSPTFRSEKLTAFEMGTRLQPSAASNLSISGFYNLYDDLRTVEITPVAIFPLSWGNGLKGYSYGFDAWADYQATTWWRLRAGWSMLIQHYRPKPGATQLLGAEQLGDDPKHRVQLQSSMTLSRAITLDSQLRYVSTLPNPYVRRYVELNARIGWALTGRLDLAVVGSNLLHKRHIEYAGASAIPRSVFAELRWRP